MTERHIGDRDDAEREVFDVSRVNSRMIEPELRHAFEIGATERDLNRLARPHPWPRKACQTRLGQLGMRASVANRVTPPIKTRAPNVAFRVVESRSISRSSGGLDRNRVWVRTKAGSTETARSSWFRRGRRNDGLGVV